MTDTERKKLLNISLKMTSVAALVFSLVIAVILLLNYINLQTSSPLESKQITALLERIDEDPQNSELRNAYRSLDFISRKAFFVSTSQINSGKILLIIGLVVFFFCMQLALLTAPRKMSVPHIPQKGKSPSPALQHFSILGITILLLVPALVLSSLNTDLISGKRSVKFLSPEEDSRGNWNNFRNMGRPWSSAQTYPVTWNGETGENILWEQQVPLPGFSSPVVWGEQVYLTSGDENTFRIECRNPENGEIKWQYDIPVKDPAALPSVQGDTGYAASTPAATAKGVFAIFATGEIFALDHQGKLLWKKSLNIPNNHYGHASSLLAYGRMVFVQFDTNNEKYVLALDENSGEEIWKTERSGEIAWSSPILAQWKEKIYLLLNSSPSVSAYDPFSGTLLWETECLSGEIAPSLAFSGGIVSAAQAYSHVCSLNIETGELLRKGDGALPDVSSPVSSGHILFIPSTYGTLTAVNAGDLTEYWYFEQNDPFYSSPVIANDRLYISDLTGRTLVFLLAEEMKLLGEASFPEPVYATPAFTDRGIIYRTKTKLYLVGGGME